MIDPTVELHPRAHVDASVTVGARTKVWQFASIIRSAVVGEDCGVATCVIIDGARIGDRCLISHVAFIGPGANIGDDVFIGPHVCVCNDAWPRTSKEEFNIDKMTSGEFTTVRVLDGASLGANVIVLPGVIIGKRAMIAAGAVVDRSVPPDCIYKRNGSIAKIDIERFRSRMREAQ